MGNFRKSSRTVVIGVLFFFNVASILKKKHISVSVCYSCMNRQHLPNRQCAANCSPHLEDFVITMVHTKQCKYYIVVHYW